MYVSHEHFSLDYSADFNGTVCNSLMTFPNHHPLTAWILTPFLYLMIFILMLVMEEIKTIFTVSD